MRRERLSFLLEWLRAELHKPLIIRGARQVGKTWLVRQLADESHKELFEINLEKRPDWAGLFSSNEPSQILINLEAAFGRKIDPNSAILFLDEIQAFPELLAKLRWFAEEMPKLPVVAAGSLLDFVLEEHTFNMPVGRIHYLHLEPMSFEEFLLAKGEERLVNYLQQFVWGVDFSQTLHSKLTSLFNEYLIIGGMPEAVFHWITESSLTQVNQIHHDLLATYRDDFAKYRGKIDNSRLEEVMMAVPRMLGTKFIYKRVNPSVNSSSIKQALELLERAKICSRVYSCAANGVPLGSEIKSKFFKVCFLDIGLVNASLGLTLNQVTSASDLTLIHKGAVAEQVVGQLLKTILPPYVEPHHYYWHREGKSSNAEIDYVIQHADRVLPIEVKAGSTGSLRSLHVFMDLKKSDLALRLNSDIPTLTDVSIKNHTSKSIQYRLLSLPIYLIGQMQRLVDSI